MTHTQRQNPGVKSGLTCDWVAAGGNSYANVISLEMTSENSE